MSIKNPDQVSLRDLFDWYKTMLQFIQSLNLNSDIQPQIKESLKKGKFYAEELLNNPDKLKNEIDQYLRQNYPFEWNRDKSGCYDETRVEKDWEQHDNLTLFAMLLNSKEFLNKWGVDYPLGANGPGLADPSQTYINRLEAVKNRCEEAQKQYYEYLINELSSHPNMAK